MVHRNPASLFLQAMSLSGDALKLAGAEFSVQLWRSWREGTIFPAAFKDKTKWVYHVQGELVRQERWWARCVRVIM